jgi:membrane-associated phospholipid phosphatase
MSLLPDHRRLSFALRLEDAVAIVFFLIYFIALLFFHGAAARQAGPATQMALVGVVALIVKQVLQQALEGKKYRAGSASDFREFARPYGEILRDWFPFVVILMMYYSLYGDATHLLVAHDRDASLIALDQKLFGFQASVVLQRFITPGLTSWMKFNYSMHLLYIPLVAGFLFVRRPRCEFRQMMCGLVLLCFCGFIGYLLVPAVGPMYTLQAQYTVPLLKSHAALERPAEFMDFARIQRDAFPSMHVAISFLIWLYAGWSSRRLFWILSPFIVSLWVSTVYLRYHYLSDCAAGLILAPACFLLANWLFARFGDFRVSLPLPGGFLEGWARSRGREGAPDLAQNPQQP